MNPRRLQSATTSSSVGSAIRGRLACVRGPPGPGWNCVQGPPGPGWNTHRVPIYEYRCENGHTFEVFQSMSDDPVSECEECGAPVERVFHPVAVHFKGSGFYNTDYKNKGKTP